MDSEIHSCPGTVTLRRNPHRKAKAKATPNLSTSSSTSRNAAAIRPFPLEEILQCDVQQQDLNPPKETHAHFHSSSEREKDNSENLRVYLRMRPLTTLLTPKTKGDGAKIALKRSKAISPNKEKNNKPKDEVCLFLNSSQSVTLTPPQAMQDSKRARTEVYDGFTRVFAPEASQTEVYEAVMDPLVSDFINGKSGMLVAMGPSGSGKTHTIFGCPRQPGVVPRTIQKIFNCTNEDGASQTPRSFYISMFEIYSERGKGEKIFDLSSGGSDLSFQQSTVNGPQEVRVFNAKEAEAWIACGMMRRTTATTNSNSQSSRSQCIINIRGSCEVSGSEIQAQLGDAVLTIVDLAGAEREKKTGNQGMRLLESNFINNTSLVFGSCLRALLEHQKNPKKPLQKHCQNSLLTRYLRDYLEGKKRMTLILTVKSGSYDYLDTSFLLRQASPFMKIKYTYAAEPNLKRRTNTFPRVEQPKRRKFGDHDANLVDERKSANSNHQIIGKELPQVDALKVSGSSQGSDIVELNGSALLKECHVELAAFKRNEKVMQKFSRALWNVLKQYKEKLEGAENEVQSLKRSLEEKNAQCLELEKEINHEKSCGCSHHQHFSGPSSDLKGNKDAESAVMHLTNDEANDTSKSKCLLHKETFLSRGEIGHQWSKGLGNMVNVAVGESTFPNMDVKHEMCKISKSFLESELDSYILKDEVGQDNSTDLITDHSQTESLFGHDNRPSMEQKTLSSEEALSSLPVPSKEEAKHTDAQNASKREPNDRSPCRSADAAKPRRRLLPACALLLSEMNSLNLEDENEKKKGHGGGRKLASGRLGQTQGSISLLRMLNGV